MDFVTIFTIQANAKVAGDFTIQLSETQYAIVQSGNILFLTFKTIALHFSPKVIQRIQRNTRCGFRFNQLCLKGPCRDGSVVGISPQGRLDCMPAECQSMDFGNKPLQMVSTQNGVCYALGTQGPCSTTSRLLGYDIFKRQPECVDVENTTSPYFLSSREAELLDRIYNQLAPDDDDYRVSLVFGNNDIGQRRQGANTGGIFQFPSSSPETLLQPCRTGARRGTNYKCTNPLV